MSVRISTWVWQHSGAAGNDLLILLALADQADDNGVCWPSATYIAKKTRLHVATVRRRLKVMAEQGRVATEKRDGTSNRYVFKFESGEYETPEQVAKYIPEASQNATPSNVLPLAPTAKGGCAPSAQGVLAPGASRTINTSVNRHSRAMFDEFWTLYPLKKGKAAAERKWASLVKSTDPAEIIAGLQAQVAALRAKDPQFIPHPTTWLNQGRWADELEPERRERGWWE